VHLHTDFVAGLFAGLSALLLFHALRGLGGFLASRGYRGLGTTLGGLATFN
jgi:hypothetical protein